MFAFPFQIKPAGEPVLYPNLRETDKSWLRAGNGWAALLFFVFATNQESRPKREWRFVSARARFFHFDQA
jgi:hypothetical protein